MVWSQWVQGHHLLCFKYELNMNCCIGKQNWCGIGLVKGLFAKNYFAVSFEILSSQSTKLKYLSSVQLLLLFEINLQSVRNCCLLIYWCSLATSNFSRNSVNSYSWLSKTAIIENKSMIIFKRNYFGGFFYLMLLLFLWSNLFYFYLSYGKVSCIT